MLVIFIEEACEQFHQLIKPSCVSISFCWKPDIHQPTTIISIVHSGHECTIN